MKNEMCVVGKHLDDSWLTDYIYHIEKCKQCKNYLENMYKKQKVNSSSIRTNYTVEGETIENKVRRVTLNKEPIKDGAPLIYTDRKEGVQAGYNVKTDRFEVAIEAMDKVSASVQAKRDARAEMKIVKEGQEDQSIQGTEGTNQ